MSQPSVVGPGSLPQRPNSDSLWKEALESLSEEDRSKIDVQAPSSQVLFELHELTKKQIERTKQGQLNFTRRNGQKVIVKDLLAKVAKWIDHFRQVGDIAIQYDPVHAALPWAGVRFLLDIAISDIKSRELILEHLTSLAEIICRYALFEGVLLKSPSAAVSELKRALLVLYINVLTYLAKAKAYFQDRRLKRSIKNTALRNPDFDSLYKAIESSQVTVDQCTTMSSVQGKFKQVKSFLKDYQIVRHEDLQKKLEAIKNPIVRLEKDLEEIKGEFDNSKLIKILQWISTEPYEKHHKQAHADVLEGTGQWLLTDPIYLDWKNDSASSILWLHGIPGSGKTKLVSTVIEDAIEDHKKALVPEPVYFYCSRNPAEPGRSRPRDIVASLLRQLARVNSKGPLFEPVTRAYGEEGERGFSQDSLELDQCRDLIMDLLPCHPMVTIIIDALDECDPQLRDELLATLERILQDSPVLVKIFVSSRDDQDIVCQLEGYPNLELSSERNSNDINSFIISEMDVLIQKRKLLRYSRDRDGLRSLVMDKLREGAKGMFRWVSLQLQALCDLKSDQAIRERVGKLPASLEELYEELLTKMQNSPAQADRQYAHNILSWLLSAQRTLKTEEFLIAVSKSMGLGPETLTKEHVLDLCSNLVIFDSTLDTFRFAHLSVREFLEKRTEYANERTHALAAEVCLLSLIGSTDTQDTWSFLKRWAFTTSDLELFERLYSYATKYWGVHCQETGQIRPGGNFENLLFYFLSNEGDDMSPFCRWESALSELVSGLFVLPGSLESKLLDCLAERPTPLFAACCFDLAYVIERYGQLVNLQVKNRNSRSCLEIILEYESWACMDILTDTHTKWVNENLSSTLLMSYHRNRLLKFLLHHKKTNIEVTDSIVESAAGDFQDGLELVKLLLDQEGQGLPISERTIEAAITNGEAGKEILDLLTSHLGGRFEQFVTEHVVRKAIWSGDREIAKTILSQADPDVYEIEDLLKRAIHSRDVFSLLLGLTDQVDISEDVVVATCRIGVQGREILELLWSQKGVQVQATDRVLKAMVENWSHGLEIINLFMARGIEIRITEDIVQYALNSHEASDATVTYLLDQHGSEISVTEETLIHVARTCGPARLKLLLHHAQDPVPLTEHVMMAVAGNAIDSDEAMNILLRNHSIEEGVFIAAAGKMTNAGPKLFAALLQQGLQHIKITENMLIAAAAENRYNASKVMESLLEQTQNPSCLTEEVFLAAARNRGDGATLMKMLLRKSKGLSCITEEVFLAAARNEERGYEMIKLLLEHKPYPATSDRIMSVAAGNRLGLRIMKLLEKWGMKVPITEDLLNAACRNLIQGFEILKWLFRRHGDDIPVTDQMLEIAARCRRCILSLLLDHRKFQGAITEKVIISAVNSSEIGPLELLVERCKDQIQVTDGILKSACRHCSKDTVDLLIEIKPQTLQINHDMIASAAENGRSGVEILKLLQETLSSESKALPITTDVVEAATRNERVWRGIKPQTEDILRLLIQSNKQQTRVSVTDTAVRSAACSGQRKVLERFRMELGYNISDEYFSIAALRNVCVDGNSDSLRDLIAKGVDPDHPDNKGWTPLFCAVEEQNTTIVEMLLQTGLVDVNRQDADGQSPIFSAVRWKNCEIIRSLLQAKAKVDIADKEGNTPESLARYFGFYGMFRYLTTKYG